MRLILLIFAGFISTILSAQNFDTTIVEGVWSTYQTVQRTTSLNFDLQNEDSSMQQPHQTIPGYENTIGWLDQGYYLSPRYNTVFNLRSNRFFEMEPEVLDHGFMSSDSIRYYSDGSPRTFLKYAQGAGNLIHLVAQHNQSISSNWSAGMNYGRNKIQNLFYDNLEQFDEERMTNGYSAQLFSHFHTRDLKYEVFADYTWNKYLIQETGGVVDQGRMDTLTGRQRLFSNSAFLSSAENLFKQRSFTVNQFFRPGSREIPDADTMLPDTNYSTIKAQWKHSFQYSTTSRRFTDGNYNELFYPSRFMSQTTNDSFHLSTWRNSFYRVQKVNESVVSFGIDHELASVKQLDGYQGNYTVLRCNGSYQSGRSSLMADFSPVGFYAGNWQLSADYHLLDDSIHHRSLTLGVESVNRRPSFNEQFIFTNYLSWNNALPSVIQHRVEAKIGLFSGLRLNTSLTSVTNYVFTDESGTPNQIGSAVFVPQLQLMLNQVWFNKLHVKLNGVYQAITDERMRLPEITGALSAYIQGNMFKKNMLAQLGFDLYYNSDFKGVWYDPASRMFRNSSVTVGGYPMLNAFLNMHVETMQLFVVGEHLLQGTTDGDWQSMAGYPLRARSIRLGASWRLFN